MRVAERTPPTAVVGGPPWRAGGERTRGRSGLGADAASPCDGLLYQHTGAGRLTGGSHPSPGTPCSVPCRGAEREDRQTSLAPSVRKTRRGRHTPARNGRCVTAPGALSRACAAYSNHCDPSGPPWRFGLFSYSDIGISMQVVLP